MTDRISLHPPHAKLEGKSIKIAYLLVSDLFNRARSAHLNASKKPFRGTTFDCLALRINDPFHGLDSLI